MIVQHPSDLAKIIAEKKDGVKSFMTLSNETQLNVFPYLELGIQRRIPHNKLKFIVNNLPSDELLNYLSSLDKGLEQTNVINLLEDKTETLNLIGYPQNSVARLVNTDFFALRKGMDVIGAIKLLRKHHKDSEVANVIYVINDAGELIDDIPIRRLILNDARKIDDLLNGSCIKLNINDTKETAVSKFKEYDRVALPVVDNNNILIGVVTIDDVLDIVESKASDTIQRFGGVDRLEYPYINTPFFSLIGKRAKWLIILFISEMLTATAMGYFGDEITKAVVLALFIPLIISSGGNSGSQAATLIIRAMAIEDLSIKHWWFVMKREIISGFIMGSVLGAIGFIRIALWHNLHWFDYSPHWYLIGLTIFFSLIGVVLWGTLIGSMIPIIMKRFKIDPAAASAPLVATIVDVTGLIIYFTVAAVILKGTLL